MTIYDLAFRGRLKRVFWLAPFGRASLEGLFAILAVTLILFTMDDLALEIVKYAAVVAMMFEAFLRVVFP